MFAESVLTKLRVPPNVKFIVDDVEDEWMYEKDPFDFIFARCLAFSIRDFPRLIKQAYNCTKPGGWVEFQDWDATCRSEDGTTKGSALEDFYNLIIDGFEKQGCDTRPGPKFEQYFRDAGFVDVKAHKFRLPLGTWPKDKHFVRPSSSSSSSFLLSSFQRLVCY